MERYKPSPTAVEVASEFWNLMATNDFHSVAVVLAAEFVLEWPQSKERIRGAERFAQMNQEYPANGPWHFKINRLVGGGSEAVSDVDVTDGVQTGRAISFFTVEQGKVIRIIEFWPEPFAASANPAHLVEAMELVLGSRRRLTHPSSLQPGKHQQGSRKRRIKTISA